MVLIICRCYYLSARWKAMFLPNPNTLIMVNKVVGCHGSNGETANNFLVLNFNDIFPLKKGRQEVLPSYLPLSTFAFLVPICA